MQIQYVVIIGSSRLPNMSAHGVRLAHLSAAFAQLGIETLLICKNNDKIEKDFFSYYDVEKNFTIKKIDFQKVGDRFSRFPFLNKIGYKIEHYLWADKVKNICQKSFRNTLFITDSCFQAWLLSKNGMRTLLEIHCIPGKISLQWLKRFTKTKGFAGIVTLTESMKYFMIDSFKISRDKIAIIHSAFDPKKFENLPTKEDARARLDLPLDVPIIGYIGRFKPMGIEKGIPQLIEAVAKMQKKRRVILFCAGGPLEYEEHYRDIASKFGLADSNFVLKGYIPHADISLHICACDILPINWDDIPELNLAASPMKMFEYMAAGGCIVASSIPSLSCVLKDKINSLLVQPGNIQCLVNAFEEILNSKVISDTISKNARIDAFANYTWQARAQKMLTHAKNILGVS